MYRPNCPRGVAALVLLLIGGLALAASGTTRKPERPPAEELGLTEYSEPLYVEDFSLPDLDGRIVPSTDFLGQIVLLNFWAPWCHPCKKELGALQAISEQFEGQGFSVVAISADPKGKERVPPFIEKLSLTFLHLLDVEREVVSQFNVHVLPTSFVVGRDGRLLSKGVGEIPWDSEAGRLYIKELLNQSPK